MFINWTLGFNRIISELQWDLILFHDVVREVLWVFGFLFVFFSLQNIENTLKLPVQVTKHLWGFAY